MQAPALPARVGIFGKLPARADFVARGLPPGFADPWHAWLVRGLTAARELLGAGFEPAYLAAPVWRFVLAPGACGGEAASGVLLPSVDSADRLFPLTLAAPGAMREESWFAALEDAGRAALDDGMAFEGWLAQVAALPAAPPGKVGEDAVVFWSDGSPHVPAGALAWPALPEGEAFARLLADPIPVQEATP